MCPLPIAALTAGNNQKVHRRMLLLYISSLSVSHNNLSLILDTHGNLTTLLYLNKQLVSVIEQAILSILTMVSTARPAIQSSCLHHCSTVTKCQFTNGQTMVGCILFKWPTISTVCDCTARSTLIHVHVYTVCVQKNFPYCLF